MSLFDKKYQVFISSTYNDLVKARDEVIKVLLKSYQIPIGMEMFSADNEEQWQTIETTIDNSDYYVLIIGHRYGSLTKESISYTEKEFDYAKSIGVPIYAFIRKRNISTLPEERDEDSKLSKKLDRFIKKVEKNAVCDFWTEASDLGTTVSIALNKAYRKNPRIGWVRADQAASPQVLEELAFLNKENRELKMELAKYANANKTKPDFRILLNDSDSIAISIPEKVARSYSFALPYDVKHARNEAEKKEIEEYNKALNANPDIAEEFNDNLKRHLRFQQAIDLKITIENIGNAKATDIYVEIQFPISIEVVEKGDNPNRRYPTWPKELPMHPINKAFQKLSKDLTIAGLMSSFDSPGIFPKIKVPNPNFWTRLKDNKVTIKLNSLLHTRTVLFEEEYIFAALDVGAYMIDVTVICSELQEPIKLSIPVVVNPE